MIIMENIIINGTEYKKTYSDKNLQIQKVGTNEIYDEAIDVLNSEYEYSETNEEILSEEDIMPENQDI